MNNTGQISQRTITTILASIVVLMTACSEENDDKKTELEGKWLGLCIGVSSTVGAKDFLSRKLVHTYSEDKLIVSNIRYSDDECSIGATEIDAEEGSLFPEPFSPPKSFSIGNKVTLTTGEEVREIDYELENGFTRKGIYLIQDGILYYGYSVHECISTATSLDEQRVCYDKREEEIYYRGGYIKE